MLNNRLTISILEAIYVIFMFRYFKTTYSFNLIPLKFLDNSEYLRHIKYSTEIPESHICIFGHNMAFVIGFFLIIRHFIPVIMKYNTAILTLIIIGCFMNINALVYFLPIVIVEVILHFCKDL